MIQVLTYNGNEENLKGHDVVINSLHDAKSLDEFKINIIDLSSKYLWFCKDNNTTSIDSVNDIRSLSIMIENSHDSEVVIMLPQNVPFMYHKFGIEYEKKCELKNMIPHLKDYILSQLYLPIKGLDIVYENTSTSLDGGIATASFYFNNITDNVFTKSVKSNKPTTVGVGNVILSTLSISNYEELIAFLRTIGLVKDKQDSPEWMKEVIMFDDEKQLKIIEENNDAIKIANDNIANAMNAINRNNEYKSILYTTGDELVKVVFEILETMIGCDLSKFEDKRKEDFLFSFDDKIFIGEIKGITPNVKKANVSQVDVHVQEYLDDHEEQKENIVSLLIINHQRNKPVSQREKVLDEQIRLAERNGSLIIETITLLRLFEQYLAGQRSREQCVGLLENKTGLLTL